VADFVDAFLIGEGEEVIVEVVRAYEQVRDAPRADQLIALARIPGVYVPRFYDVAYHPGGTVASVTPNRPGVPERVQKRVLAVLPPPPTRQLVPNVSITHERGVIEIQRGCIRGCRFCHAGIVTRPVRERPPEEILAAAGRILEQTGYEELALLSLSSSDYSHIEEVVKGLAERYAGRHLSLSLPSLRIESFSVDLADAISEGRRTGFTFAPEAGTERMRRVINKDIPTGHMLEIARQVFERGWRTVKLYFMIGLPGEQAADVEAIIDLAYAVRSAGRKAHGRRAQVNVSVGTFVPKPHTPFQWAGLAAMDEIRTRQAELRRRLRGRGLKLSWNDPHTTLLEAALSRGDRRLSAVVQRAWERGARFDGWDEGFDAGTWAAAFAEIGLDPDFYAHRERPPDEVFPWDHIDVGVRKSFLLRQWELSCYAETRPDCRTQCTGCGIMTEFGTMWAPEWACPSKEQDTP
jgi:radical SAM family uncharacterized protein